MRMSYFHWTLFAPANGSAISWPHCVRRLIEITCRPRQTRRTLLGWLQVEQSNKLKRLNAETCNRRAEIGKRRPGRARVWLQEWLKQGLPPLPLFSAAEERGMRFSNVLPRVALVPRLRQTPARQVAYPGLLSETPPGFLRRRMELRLELNGLWPYLTCRV
jgi:hypothetical protein